jgi:hypothetical protein
VFQFRPFSRYEQVRDEIEHSDLIFLLPHQLELLPDATADLFLNISSLHEMRAEQIAYYLRQIARLTAGWFYMKQWKESRNAYDGIVVREHDYPIPAAWRRLYHRECRVHTRFFEALYET